MPTYYFEHNFSLTMTRAQAQEISHQGNCTGEIIELLENPKIQAQFKRICPTCIADELREYGAWSEEELSDDTANQERILWIAGGNIAEEPLDFISDPAHGWLKVELEEITDEMDISQFSYRDDEFAYLEEDSDMQKYLTTLPRGPEYNCIHLNDPAPLRNFERINFTGSYVYNSKKEMK